VTSCGERGEEYFYEGEFSSLFAVPENKPGGKGVGEGHVLGKTPTKRKKGMV